MRRGVIATVSIWFFTIFTGLIFLLPVYWIFMSSLTPKELLFTSPVHYFPSKLTLENYIHLFESVKVGLLAKNTLIIISITLVATISFCLVASYAFARIPFKGAKASMTFLMVSAMLPPTATIIPLYQYVSELKLIDTYTAMVILYTSSFIPFTVVLFVSFLTQLPNTLEDAAMVDGAGILTTIFKIILPVMKPIIATMAIINFIHGMNEFTIPLIFAMDQVKPLSIGITEIPRIDQYQVPWETISALASIMLVPIVTFVLIFERHIMEGLMAGSIKG
ncbi:carbohydrate ABC transporter permease [Paenibacillus filicis]|uniref:Carbohydrate ABC transporter permease n=1 Tax=Paenibacillus gyeongsangnamensis TaxID=3388067 RepID=A0ABT4Q4D1_9BACL|nr:carbohydrate ABC transporter permease [Paenibacillus filicis]MCZ8511725.1 carbohydrate ABC transporter permease [Paenibacillus filicis]